MRILSLSIGTMVMRLHAMSALVVTAGFLGFLYIGIVLGMILFLATLMGVKWSDINPFRHVSHKSYDWQHQHRHLHKPIH